MQTNFAIFVMACSIIGGHATPLLPGCALPFGRHEHAPGTGLPGARHSVPSLQLLAKSTGLPATDSFQASTILERAASVAGTKEVVRQIGRLLNAVTFAAFLSSGSSDCLIGGSAVSAAGGVGAVRGDTLAILSGDYDRFGLESTATGHDVALDVDKAIRAYLTGKPTKNQSLLHEGGHGSGGETLSGPVRSGPVRSGPVRSGPVPRRTLKVKQVSRKLPAGGLLGRGEACINHDKCQGKCKGDRGEDMKCRVKLADCKRYGHHSIKRWGCPDGWACAPIGDLKWGSCTAAPTTSPTLAPTLSPTENPTTSPTSSIPAGTLMWTKNAEMFAGGGYSNTGDNIHNGLLFITEDHHAIPGPTVFAVNVATREVIWRAEIPQVVNSQGNLWGAGGPGKAVYDDGIVYVGAHQFFGAFNALTGALIWKFNDNESGWIREPLIVGGITIVPSKETVYAWNKKTGAEVWTFQTGAHNFGSPAYGGGNVYFGSDNHMLYAVNVATGQEVWKYDAVYKIRAGVAYNNGVVYVGPLGDRDNTNSASGSVIAVNAVTGAETWHKSINGQTTKSYAYAYEAGLVYSNGMVYVSTQEGMIVLDALSGNVQWRHTASQIHATPKISGDRIYFGSGTGFLFALNANTGVEEWKYKTTNAIYDASPTLSNGRIYIGDSGPNSKIYALTALTA